MKRLIFMIVGVGSALTAFLFFQPVSNDGEGLTSPTTLASPVANASEQPAAISGNAVTENLISNSPILKTKSPTLGTAINAPQSISGSLSIPGGLSIQVGGDGDDDDDDGDDDGDGDDDYEDDDEDEEDDDEGDDD